MHSPAISVLLPVYNGQEYIEASVKSILDQTFSDFELLILDDGSTDSTPALVQRFSDPRVCLFRLDHVGLVAALNFGIERARGTFLARMDADDLAMPQRFATQIAHFENFPELDIVCSDVIIIDGQGRPSGRQSQARFTNEVLRDGLLFRRAIKPLIHPSVMMRRVAATDLGGYRSFTHAEDHDLWLRAIDRYRFARISTPLLRYRVYSGGISRMRQAEQAAASAMSAVNYLVLQSTQIDLFAERPEIFYDAQASLARQLDAEVLEAALAFRRARTMILGGRPIRGWLELIQVIMRHGIAALPWASTRLIGRKVESISRELVVSLRAEAS